MALRWPTHDDARRHDSEVRGFKEPEHTPALAFLDPINSPAVVMNRVTASRRWISPETSSACPAGHAHGFTESAEPAALLSLTL